MATSETIQLPKTVGAALAALAMVGFLSGGFALGVLSEQGAAQHTTATGGSSGGSAALTPTTGSPTPASPFVVGKPVNWRLPMETLTGHQTTLARGSKATVIMAMASWCLYCGYEDKYVLPALAKTPGVAIDIVDVSPQGGIADPGPETPPFSGHDGTGGPLTVRAMEAVMQQYVKTYGTLTASNIHVFVAPQTTQAAWNIQSFPTLAFVNARGVVSAAPPGAQTIPQAQAELQQAVGG